MGDIRKLATPAALLVLVQLVHGAVPGPGEGGTILGLIFGVAFLVAAVTAFFGARADKQWTAPLLRWTGASVAVGFVVYHAVPFKTPLNYPYWGDTTANAGQLAPVFAAIVIGAWCAWLARPAAVVERGKVAVARVDGRVTEGDRSQGRGGDGKSDQRNLDERR